jgi:hypothetical protein
LKLSKNAVTLLVGLLDPLGLDLLEELGLLWLKEVEVLEREVKLDEILTNVHILEELRSLEKGRERQSKVNWEAGGSLKFGICNF